MQRRELNEVWTAYVVARLHRYRIPRKVLADKCGYSLTYLSLVLNGNKEFSSDRAKDRTKNHIIKNLQALEKDILDELKREDLYEYPDNA